jgi:hypothetical protein
MLMPGWFCGACSGFNGEGKEKILMCRYCGDVDRPDILTHAEARAMALEAIERPTEAACLKLAELIVHVTATHRDFEEKS